jgi:hypothetical protein
MSTQLILHRNIRDETIVLKMNKPLEHDMEKS